jgi:hypothetical protein
MSGPPMTYEFGAKATAYCRVCGKAARSDSIDATLRWGTAHRCQSVVDSDLGWPDCNCQPERPAPGECWCSGDPPCCDGGGQDRGGESTPRAAIDPLPHA